MTYDIKQGDSFKLIKEIPDASVDAIITDPPYNLGETSTGNIKNLRDKKNKEDPNKLRKDMNMDIAEWDKNFDPTGLVPDFKRIIKPEGNVFIFTSHALFGKWYDLLTPQFDRTTFFVWHKTNPTPQVRKVSFLQSCELVICAWNQKHKWNFDKQNTMHNFYQSSICMGSERFKDDQHHPTQKPRALMEHLIRIATDTGDVVYDPFLGTGTTLDAACGLGRIGWGSEMDPVHFETVKNRLAKYDAPWNE